MSQLLAFLVDAVLSDRAGGLKETVIGVEVFRRAADYDPKTDPVVRKEARRLRLKLQEYYGGSGQGERLRIDLPKGGYTAVFSELTTEAEPPPAMTPAAHRGGTPRWAPAAAVALLAIAVFGLLMARNNKPSLPPVPRKFTTGSGNSRSPVFSPDGTRLAYSVDDHGASRIMVSAVAAQIAQDIPWTDGRSLDYEPAWSPDGKKIAFLRRLPGERYELRIATAPDASTKIGEISSRDGIDWSPDGTWIAVSDQVAPGAPKAIFLVDAGSESQNARRRQVTTPAAGILGDGKPRFSPDGKHLSFLRSIADGADDIYVLDLERGGSPRQVTSEARLMGAYCWLPGGRELLVSFSHREQARSLWRINIADGSMRRVAEAGVEPLTPAASPKGNAIAWVSIVQDTNIWRLSLDGSAPDRAVIASSGPDTSPQVSPDGRYLAFRSSRTGFNEIWVSNINGENPRQLTFMKGPINLNPRWSADGKSIVFDSRVAGNANIYRIGLAGGEPQRLTTDNVNHTAPSCSRDGRYVYFSSDKAGSPRIYRMPLAGGPSERVTMEGGGAAFESPDGKTLYYSRGPELAGLWRLPLDRPGAAEEVVIRDFDKVMWGNWAVGSKGIYYVRRETGPPPKWQILFLDFATGNATVIRDLPRQPVLWDSGLALSPDEKTLYYTILDSSASDIYLLDGFR